MDDLQDEFEDKLRQEKEDRLDMTQEDIDKAQEIIYECDYIRRQLEGLEGNISNDEIRGFVSDLLDWFVGNDMAGGLIKDCQEKIENWEDYDPNDYISNEGL